MAKKSVEPKAHHFKTLGPVSDLERHLPTDWWRTLFTSMYLKTDGDVVENEKNTQKEVDLLVDTTGIRPEDKVLDLCCGQGRHCIELAKRGFKGVTGLDRSRYLIRLAKRRSKTMLISPAFHEGDARKFRFPDDTFDCVAMFGNSFGYFKNEDDDVEVLEHIKRVLKTNGTLFMDLVDGEWMKTHFEQRSWEWIDQNHFVCRERSLTPAGNRLISREVVVHADRGVIADQFYAERLYTKDNIRKLLSEVGFDNIRFHNTLQTESDRNQDLGMMAHRVFLTTRLARSKIANLKKGPAFPEVTIVMGDPILPDSVKLNGQFNPEDFETINHLKGACTELKEFKFTFLNNHATLIKDLMHKPPKFVFNLCDEGFNNDAFMELHVPAVLEMLQIPYTGAGPSCLGMCYNKSITGAIAQSLDIPVPLETYFNPEDTAATLPSVFPALIKPNFGDSSIGITKDAVVNSIDEILNYMDRLRNELPNTPVLIQEFLEGPEYSVGIIGNPNLSSHVLPILEVDYSGLNNDLPKILGYESKWDPKSPYWSQIKYHEAKIDEETRRTLVDYASKLFERMGCRDYARFDFRTDSKGKIKLLEVNPNAGWCWDGKLNIMAGFEGLNYAGLVRMILNAAQERYIASAGRQGESNTAPTPTTGAVIQHTGGVIQNSSATNGNGSGSVNGSSPEKTMSATNGKH